MKLRLLALSTMVLALAGMPDRIAAATMYKWVDENGTVHYSENPPAGVDAAPVRNKNLTAVPVVTRKPPEAAPESVDGEPEVPEKSIAQQRREERAEARQKARQQRAEIEAQCQAMRQQLSWVEPNPRVIIQDADGTTRRMDDDERVKLVNEAKEFLANNDCD